MKPNRKYIIFFILFGIVVSFIWIIQLLNDAVPYVDLWTRGLVGELEDTYIFTFFRFMTEFGSGTFLTPFVIIFAFVLAYLYRSWLAPLFFAGGTLLSHLINLGIKAAVERDRPSILAEANATGYSFPSGHAMISMVCYGLLSYFICKKLTSNKAIMITQIFFATIIFLIGISRYVINVHYLTDVAAGFVAGFVCLLGFICIYEITQNRRVS